MAVKTGKGKERQEPTCESYQSPTNPSMPEPPLGRDCRQKILVSMDSEGWYGLNYALEISKGCLEPTIYNSRARGGQYSKSREAWEVMCGASQSGLTTVEVEEAYRQWQEWHAQLDIPQGIKRTSRTGHGSDDTAPKRRKSFGRNRSKSLSFL
ncbi:hypothetical protein BD413DRAFT_547484 [Trametes elegans]|nr:hypothetical protein BD413DRAFT_547484 [Trametes elegans]